MSDPGAPAPRPGAPAPRPGAPDPGAPAPTTAAAATGVASAARPGRWLRPALLVAGAAFAALALRDGIAPHDEGLMLAAARRVADGQLPYRDFWFNYGPAQPYVLAALQELVGPSLLAWRVLLVAIDAVAALLVFELVLSTAGARIALLAWAAAIAAFAWPALPGPNAPALALALAALLTTRAPLAGALAGAAALFRPEIGVAAALGLLLAGGGHRALLASAGVAVAGWLPFVLAAPSRWWHETVGFVTIQHLQRLPLPLDYDGGLDPNKLLEFYFPALLVVMAIVTLVAQRARHPTTPLVAAGLLYLLARPDEFHLIVLAVALAVAMGTAARRPVFLVGLAVIALHGADRQLGGVAHRGALAAVPGPAGDGVRTERDDAAALRVLRARVPPGPLFVAPPRMDRVSAGDPLLYTILDRDNPTRYDVIQPGVVTTARVQREIVADLRRTRATVIRWLDQRARHTGPTSYDGARIFDAFVDASYRPAFRAGPYLVLLPR